MISSIFESIKEYITWNVKGMTSICVGLAAKAQCSVQRDLKIAVKNKKNTVKKMIDAC